MAKIWILVANNSSAHLYQTENRGKEIISLKKFDHPEGRKKGEELETDGPGRSFDSIGSGRHATEPRTDIRTKEVQHFAKELVDFLELELSKTHFDQLVVTASPQLLGELRQNFSETLKKSIKLELNKDFPEYMNQDELFSHLRTELEF